MLCNLGFQMWPLHIMLSSIGSIMLWDASGSYPVLFRHCSMSNEILHQLLKVVACLLNQIKLKAKNLNENLNMFAG